MKSSEDIGHQKPPKSMSNLLDLNSCNL